MEIETTPAAKCLGARWQHDLSASHAVLKTSARPGKHSLHLETSVPFMEVSTLSLVVASFTRTHPNQSDRGECRLDVFSGKLKTELYLYLALLFYCFFILHFLNLLLL